MPSKRPAGWYIQTNPLHAWVLVKYGQAAVQYQLIIHGAIQMLNECLREADAESVFPRNFSRCVDVQGCLFLHYTEWERCGSGRIRLEINEPRCALQINVYMFSSLCMCACVCMCA